MAKALNKTRVRDSRIAAGAAILVYLFSRGLFPSETPLHEVNEYIGYFLIIFCVFGRIFCTAYIGGRKNQELVTKGPFSITRNPLYVCSLIGIIGAGLMSNRISVLVTLLVMHIVMYYFLIRREEKLLDATFGDAFRAYCARVPRFWPKFSLHEASDTIELRPKFLVKAMRDAFAWFLIYPAFELIEYLQGAGYIPTYYLLP